MIEETRRRRTRQKVGLKKSNRIEKGKRLSGTKRYTGRIKKPCIDIYSSDLNGKDIVEFVFGRKF